MCIRDREEADREVPYAMYINRVEGGKASVTISNYTDEEILYGTEDVYKRQRQSLPKNIKLRMPCR